jgi:LacI family transcriptional regulator
MLTGRSDLQSARLREEGYRQALAAAGVPVDEKLIQAGDYDADVSATSALRMLKSVDRPTAIFAANDISAIATVSSAASLGIRVPDDLSVVGFDNVPESALNTPPLTTIHQPIREMGQSAIDLLIRLIHGEPADPTHLTLATSLVVRQSTSIPHAALGAP